MSDNPTIHNSQFTIHNSVIQRELSPFVRLGRHWLAVLVVFAALGLAMLAAYQVRPTVDLPIDSKLIGRNGVPFFDQSLYGIEQVKGADGTLLYPYRWTKPAFAITLPGLARQPYSLTLSISGARPADAPPSVVTITVGAEGEERQIASFSPEASLREYDFLIPPADVDGGTVRVVVSTNGFRPSGDPRDLGLILNRAKFVPVGDAGFILPPRDVIIGLGLALALLLLGLARLGWGRRIFLGAGLGFAIACGLWLALDRLFLTAVAPYLWQALLAAYIALLIADYIMLGLRQYRGVLGDASSDAAGRAWPPNLVRWLLTIFFAAFAIRLAGELHPQILVVDLFFHVHRLEDVLDGKLLFRVKSSEWAGHQTFYLPTTYVFVAPLSWLLGSSEAQQSLAVRVFTVAMDTSALFIIATIGRLVAGRVAGLSAALLYVAMPIGVLPFSWGITSNLFGQYVLLWVLALFVSGVPEFEGGWQGRPSGRLLLFTFFLTLALLSHPGVVPLTLATLGLIVLGRAGAAIRKQRPWRGVLTLVAVCLVSGVISIALYYRNVIPDTLTDYAAIQQERAQAQAADRANGITFRRITGGSVNDPSIGLEPHTVFDAGQWLGEGISGYFREAWAYYAAWPIFAFLGYLLLWRAHGASAERRRFYPLMFAWLVVALLFAVLGLVLNLYVRYGLYLMPIVAVGGGILLAYLWRERWGRTLALLLGAYTVATALLLWYQRIMIYQHG